MIALTAATGNIGRQLAGLLGAAGTPARLLVRDKGNIETFGGVLEAVVVDLDRAESLDTALTGVTHLFLLSPGPDTPTQDAAAIAAAQRAGVRHVVLLSSLGVELGGIGGGRPHAPGEAVLMASGLDWTILRPSEFMTNTLGWLPELKARGTASVPSGDGKVGYIDPADIAAVVCAALTKSGHAGRTYRLTGPELLSAGEVVERIGTVLGKPLKHLDVGDSEFRANARTAHMPAMMIDTLSEYYGGVKGGKMEVLTSDVEQVIGRPPHPYLDWARTTMVL